MTERSNQSVKRLVLGAILAALVIVLQLMGQFIHFGPFSISLVLVPIVLGAALCGPLTAAFLGGVFGAVVLFQPDTAAFMGISVFGTVVTVLLKGILCGLVSGLVYRAFEKKGSFVATLLAAIVCPLVNTGVFLFGCLVFFLETVASWGVAGGFTSTAEYLLIGMVGLNFVAELVFNVVLTPVIVRLLKLRAKN
ncbi:MAG: ECF transporter S component [Clostridia bacterium]|nr:ECF transporter S component [Clostridia bacterium]MBQ2731282.1 ECF transporter S component [Clostridia bacterium]